MLLLERFPADLPMESIVAQVREVPGWEDAESFIEGSIAQLRGHSANFVILPLPRPIPKSEIGGLRIPPWHWPDWEPEFDRHAAHVLVVHDCDRKSVDDAYKLLRAASIIGANLSTVACYWGDAPVWCSFENFQAFIGSPSPLPLCVGAYVSGDDDEVWLETLGMHQFGKSEIALQIQGEDTPAQLGTLYDIAKYTMNTPVRPGHTLETDRLYRAGKRKSIITGKRMLSIVPE